MIEPPQRDEDGIVIPHDHEQILAEHEIIRRISSLWVKDGRISSLAYSASSGKNGGMSVDIKELIESDGIDPKKFVMETTPRLAGAVTFKVGTLRKMKYQVGYDPRTSPEPNPYHGEVWGNFSKSAKKELRKHAEWLIQIPGVKTA